jgi:hypothetical protein
VGAALDLVGEYTRRSAAAGGFDHSASQLRRLLVRVDEKAYEQIGAELERLVARIEKIEESAVERLAKTGADAEPFDAGVSLMLFEGVRLAGSERDRRPRRGPRRRFAPSQNGASG